MVRMLYQHHQQQPSMKGVVTDSHISAHFGIRAKTCTPSIPSNLILRKENRRCARRSEFFFLLSDFRVRADRPLLLINRDPRSFITCTLVRRIGLRICSQHKATVFGCSKDYTAVLTNECFIQSGLSYCLHIALFDRWFSEPESILLFHFQSTIHHQCD